METPQTPLPAQELQSRLLRPDGITFGALAESSSAGSWRRALLVRQAAARRRDEAGGRVFAWSGGAGGRWVAGFVLLQDQVDFLLKKPPGGITKAIFRDG